MKLEARPSSLVTLTIRMCISSLEILRSLTCSVTWSRLVDLPWHTWSRGPRGPEPPGKCRGCERTRGQHDFSWDWWTLRNQLPASGGGLGCCQPVKDVFEICPCFWFPVLCCQVWAVCRSTSKCYKRVHKVLDSNRWQVIVIVRITSALCSLWRIFYSLLFIIGLTIPRRGHMKITNRNI